MPSGSLLVEQCPSSVGMTEAQGMEMFLSEPRQGHRAHTGACSAVLSWAMSSSGALQGWLNPKIQTFVCVAQVGSVCGPAWQRSLDAGDNLPEGVCWTN